MTLTKKQQKSFLMKCDKEELINAILQECSSNEFSYIIYRLWNSKHNKLYEKMKKSGEEEIRALQEYSNFVNNLSKKYGDGKSFDIMLISKDESNELLRLDKLWKIKTKAHDKYSKELDEFYKENGEI